MTIYKIGENYIEADNTLQALEYCNLIGLLGKPEVESHPSIRDRALAKINKSRALVAIANQLNENAPTRSDSDRKGK